MFLPLLRMDSNNWVVLSSSSCNRRIVCSKRKCIRSCCLSPQRCQSLGTKKNKLIISRVNYRQPPVKLQHFPPSKVHFGFPSEKKTDDVVR